MYLTFEEYTEFGGTVPQSSFDKLEMLASYKLDYWTQDRITEVDEKIKFCVYLIIEKLYEIENGESDVSSFSNDGVSVTLADAKTSKQKLEDVYWQVVEILPVKLVSVVIE